MHPPDFPAHGVFNWRDQSFWQFILLLMVAGAAAWMVSHMHEVVNPSEKNDPLKTSSSLEEKEEDLPRPRARPFVGFDVADEKISDPARDAFREASSVLRQALGTNSPSLLAGWVRHPAVTVPRIKCTPPKRLVMPALPLTIGPRFGITGDLLLTTVRLVDGTERPVVMEKTPEGFKLDWESLTGWCEADFDGLQTHVGIKVHPRLMRVRCQPTSARAPFSDEEGIALVISHPTETGTLSTFVPETVLKQSPAGAELRNTRGGPFTLRIAPDRETIQHGWVRVEEIVCSGWVTDH